MAKGKFYDYWLRCDTNTLWDSLLRFNRLTPALDCIGTKRDYRAVYELTEATQSLQSDDGAEELKVPYLPFIASTPFTPFVTLAPVTLRYLLGSRNKSVHLGVLALGCWLDRPTTSMPLVNEFLKTHQVSWDEIYRGMKLARSLGLVRSQRSRPDIGRHYRQLYAKAKG